MECAREACKKYIAGDKRFQIWNLGDNRSRVYCVACGTKILDFNQHDTLKLKYEVIPADLELNSRDDSMVLQVALAEYINARSPVEEYVRKRYTGDGYSPQWLSEKLVSVTRNLEIATALRDQLFR